MHQVAATTYAQCLRDTERIAWKIDNILPTCQRLDFSRPFLPAALTRAEHMDAVRGEQWRTANHLTSNAYLCISVLIEEYVASIGMELAYAGGRSGHEDRTRALMCCAGEAFKHQQLFRRYSRAFARDVTHPCRVVGPVRGAAVFGSRKSRIALLLFMLHLSLNTQKHATRSAEARGAIDPLFASLLQHHWMEEMQHAGIATMELVQEVAHASPAAIEQAIEEYLEQAGAFARLLDIQAALDVSCLEQAGPRTLGHGERHALLQSQRSAYWQLFLACGMLHWRFLSTCRQLTAAAPGRIIEWVRQHGPEQRPGAG